MPEVPDPQDVLGEFLELYAAGRFFEAHEVLEGAWRRSPEAPMPFLQGLIQWAVSLEHHRRGNAHGARVLLERAMRNLAHAPAGSLGIDISACHAAAPGLRRSFGRWEDGGARPAVDPPPIRRRREGDDRA